MIPFITAGGQKYRLWSLRRCLNPHFREYDDGMNTADALYYTQKEREAPGNAILFVSADSQLVYAADSSDFDVTGDFWVAGWVKKISGTFAIIFGKEGADVGRDYDMFVDGGNVLFSLWDNSETRFDATASGVISDTAWHFVLGWYDATAKTINVQVDGGTVTSTSFTGTPNVSGEQFSIGGLQGDSLYCDCAIDTTIFGKSPSGGVGSIISTIGGTLYNSGAGLAAKRLTETQIADWGIVSGWDFDGDLGDAIGSNTLTGLNSPGYTTGIVARL